MHHTATLVCNIQLNLGLFIDILSVGGVRQLKMDDKFFTGYRKTLLNPTEVLMYIHIPFSTKVTKL